MKNRIKGIEGFVSISFLICAVLFGYVFPGVDSTPLGIVLLALISAFVIVVVNHMKIKLAYSHEKILVFLVAYIVFDQMIVSMIFSYYSAQLMIKSLIFIIICVMPVLVLKSKINYDIFYKTYWIIGVISCIGLAYQAVQVYFLKQLTRMIVLPGMEGLISDARLNYINYAYNRTRPSSIFPEPATFSTFIAPLVIMCIRKRKYLIAALMSICIILSTSTTGVVLVILIWGYWAFVSTKNIAYKVSAALFISCMAFFVLNYDVFSTSINKLTNVDIQSNERIASAFTVLFQMPFKHLLTGVGSGNLAEYLMHNRSINMSGIAVTVDGYVTSMAGNFILYGIIGGITYIVFCLSLLKTKNQWARFVGILVIILSFVQTMPFTGDGILWLVFYGVLDRNETEERNQNIQVMENRSNESVSC